MVTALTGDLLVQQPTKDISVEESESVSGVVGGVTVVEFDGSLVCMYDSSFNFSKSSSSDSTESSFGSGVESAEESLSRDFFCSITVVAIVPTSSSDSELDSFSSSAWARSAS
ncbi:hypothetical protein WICPIJ_006938 [Wickerhamomyces pijperi]|uniref:Uncharacterized protein n=1 Tax=Wickerhamomyces pijperi TaxID=599730 RepID=A0A9P8Q3B1_WICPI|nr:hypothetical protein WICPIJ_006938 [Wickerhamomyces pijperi]